MGARLTLAVAAGAWSAAPPSLAAQQPGSFLDLGVHSTATAVLDGPVGIVVGPRLAIRTMGSTRAAFSLGAGVRDGEGSARGTFSLEYLLTPRAAGRLGVYVGGGLLGVLGNGNGGYLLAVVGAEQSPGRRGGWSVEGGIGSGFHLRLAYHWRRLPGGWRAER